jgi:hypothetical protein
MYANPAVSKASARGRLEERISQDVILRDVFGSGLVRLGGMRVTPSGLDAAACVIARTLVEEGHASVAIAFPRGRGEHPALLGLYLALWRHLAPGRLSGSVLVSTNRSAMSNTMRDLVYDAAEFEKLTIGRLVAVSVPNSGGPDINGNPRPPRRRAAIRPLDRSPRAGISQVHGHLMFARPNTAPRMVKNVVWAMVVDTVGTAGPRSHGEVTPEHVDSWTQTFDSNCADHRKQLWLGELGDADFVRFCESRRIPLVTFDWPLIQSLRQSGPGAGPLTSVSVVARAVPRPGVFCHLVEDDERDELARETYMLLHKLRRRGGDNNDPKVVNTAYRLCGLLCRLPCTRKAYDSAVYGAFAETIDRMWTSVDNTRSSAFVGAKWKEGHRRYWDGIRSCLRRLIKLQEHEDTCSKYDALIERIGEAQANGECVRVVCQTNAERGAVKATLREFGVTEEQATVHSFGTRFSYGAAGSKFVTLLVGPPPPWKAGILASAEEGQVEVLCYPHEAPRLEARLTECARSHEPENAVALNALGIGNHSAPAVSAPDVAPIRLHSYRQRHSEPETDEWSAEVPAAGSELWRELLESFGQELPDGPLTDEEEVSAGMSTTPYTGHARLVRFSDAPPVFMRDDGEVDVLMGSDREREDDGDETLTVRIGDLRAGMTVAFLPGGQRSLLDVLLAAYDQRLSLEAKMFAPMWQRALTSAVATHGYDGLAALTERTPGAVRSWAIGRNIPQQEWRFKRLIEASGEDDAIRAQVSLWRYLTATRGPHRQIGRLNHLAVVETARDDASQAHLRQLEQYVGMDLEDLYDQVEPLHVASVSAPMPVPLSRCGQFLDDDDPYLRRST